jgi:short-subunit dehydrogenase
MRTTNTSATKGPTQSIALITGASAGIGAVYADRLARRGHDLILVARNAERLASVAQRLGRQTGRSVETIVADLADKADVERVAARLRADPCITVLVNNAGLGATAPLLDSDPVALATMIAVNVGALTQLTHAAVPGFVARGGGTIINIASIVAIAPERLNGVYGGTKAFVLAFSQSLQHELAAQGVRVQAVLPGATATEFWDKSGRPVHTLPAAIVMSAEDMVDAALSGLDQGELVTIPALADKAEWDSFDAARRAMSGHLSSAIAAPRYTLARAQPDRVAPHGAH